MVVNGRPLKRVKRRVTADLQDFLTFPAAGGDEIAGEGPFRVRVRAFLSRHGRLPPPASILSPSPHLLTWRVAFRVGGGGKGEEEEEPSPPERGTVELDVVEEDVPRSKSIYCDQCRVVGWSDHPVCGKRYHFIIRNDTNPKSGYHQTCGRCGSVLPLSDSRCSTCKYEMTSDDFEDCAYLQLENSSHLLHGVVHANGYGHLLRVNGREGGSKYLTGCDIMAFWDRLCKVLHVRKVTVMDISKKHEMEYRLLHAVTAGRPWYGNWGYQFGAGSYALTAEAYQNAVETLSFVPLSVFFSHARSLRTPLQNAIAFYWSISDRPLVTVRDLFRYVTHLLHEAHQHRLAENLSEKVAVESTSQVLCAWTSEDIEQAENTMVKVLRAVGLSRWVTWRALRGATCHAVKSAELLDYCLKGLGGKSTDDGMVVAMRCNSETNAIEYRLEAGRNGMLAGRCSTEPSPDHLLRDLKFLYDTLLDPAKMQSYKPQAVQESAKTAAAKLLDCKQFVKHYDESESDWLTGNPFAFCIWCHVELVDHPKDYTAPPPELLVLPATATVADLKLQAAKAFQETYLVFQTFQAERLLDHGDVSDTTPVKLVLGSNCVARIRGRCIGDDRRLGQFRKERGPENWIVDCTCGAKDDDGERMLACDACGVWQHTRCAGINDYEEVPARFVCRKCVGFRKTKGRGGGRLKGRSTSGGFERCKDEMDSSITIAGRFGRMTTVG